MIDDLAGVIEGDIQHRVDDVVAQASRATGLLSKLDLAQLSVLVLCDGYDDQDAGGDRFAFFDHQKKAAAILRSLADLA